MTTESSSTESPSTESPSTESPSTESPSTGTTSIASEPRPARYPARYRCTACGNLTRFDVVTHRRTKAFHHYSVGGELTIEEENVLDETVEGVSCRWCGHGNAIVTVEPDDESSE